MLYGGISEPNFYHFCDALPEEVAWYFGERLTSFGFKRTSEGWLLSIKISGYGHGRILFVAGNTIADCIELFYSFCRSRATTGLKWVIAKW